MNSKEDRDLMKKTGSRIAAARARRRYTQRRLAKRMGVSPGNVSMWESGSQMPGGCILVTLANALRCSTDYLLGRSDYPDLY